MREELTYLLCLANRDPGSTGQLVASFRKWMRSRGFFFTTPTPTGWAAGFDHDSLGWGDETEVGSGIPKMCKGDLEDYYGIHL